MRATRLGIGLGGAAIAIAAGLAGAFYGIRHPGQIGSLRRTADFVIAVGIAVMAFGFWRRRA